jgi:hypothetical protein
MQTAFTPAFTFDTARGPTECATSEDLDIILSRPGVIQMILAERAEVLFVPVTPRQLAQLHAEFLTGNESIDAHLESNAEEIETQAQAYAKSYNVSIEDARRDVTDEYIQGWCDDVTDPNRDEPHDHAYNAADRADRYGDRDY